jgi:predicted TIM-barrel fold metal-dependent hydrolase
MHQPLPYRVTDVHIHIQPWRDMKPAVQAAMRRGKEAHWDFLLSMMDDPKVLLDIMDRSGVWRVGLVNYVSPDVMGFTDTTNTFVARYAEAAPERLLPYGGIHPRYTTDPAGDVDRLVGLGIRLLKIHPPHMAFPANAYTEGLAALGTVYRRCEERGLPVMIHTGTSIFPGARSKYGNPLEIDDVAIDFPDLRIVMAHGGRPFWMEEAFFVLRRHPNVWLDVSGIPPLKLLEYFPRFGEIGTKVLWGTDWPSPGVKDLRLNIDQFLTLPLADDLRRAVLETNPLAFFPAR